MNGNGNGWRKVLDVIRSVSVLLTPLLLVFVAYMQLAEDKRARERWEEDAFSRRVLQIVDTRPAGKFATREDLNALRQDLSPSRDGNGERIRQLELGQARIETQLQTIKAALERIEKKVNG